MITSNTGLKARLGGSARLLAALRFAGLGVAMMAGACAEPGADGLASIVDPLTGLSGAERGLHFTASVYVSENASDDEVAAAIQSQVQTAIGALRDERISLNDRLSHENLDPARWTRERVVVQDPSNPATSSYALTRVTFPYDDRSVVGDELSAQSVVSFTMLSQSYPAHAAPLKQSCSDDVSTDTGSLWYHFEPQRPACVSLMDDEIEAIADEQRALGNQAAVVGPREANRWFVPVTAKLDPPNEPSHDFYPDYQRLYGLGTQKDRLVIYVMMGVDGYAPEDAYHPDDALGQEAVSFYRALTRGLPELRPVKVMPTTELTEVQVNGKWLAGITLDQMLTWSLDKKSYPAQATTAAARESLRRQAQAKLAERWIYWEAPLTIHHPHGTKQLVLELRTFFGSEDGFPEARERARARYREAFKQADVLLYNGHSHFGWGPLDPQQYGSQDFDDRYQIYGINSCISYNYYHQDFIDMKPGGTQNLDMIVNGLPSWVKGGGLAMARLALSFAAPEPRTYRQILEDMRVDLPWASDYEPMRVVDGELDNSFDVVTQPLALSVVQNGGAPASHAPDFQRTVVFLKALTMPGEDLFVRGGVDHARYAERTGSYCDAAGFGCALPIEHLNLANGTTAPWKAGDTYLDWYGSEAGQTGLSHGIRGSGTAADWTTDQWPASWGPARTVAEDGYGVEPLNTFGHGYWMVDVMMDCSRGYVDTNGVSWFELKAFIAGGAGWERDVAQQDAPYVSANHFAKCGQMSIFEFGASSASYAPLPTE